jgi:hypothetical protein
MITFLEIGPSISLYYIRLPWDFTRPRAMRNLDSKHRYGLAGVEGIQKNPLRILRIVCLLGKISAMDVSIR